MNHRLTVVDITDDEDDITETIHPEDGDEWGRFFRGLLYGTATAIVVWVGIGVAVWAVWPR